MIEKGTIMESEAEPSSKELLKIYDTALAEKLMQKLLPMIENCAKQTRSEKVVVAVSGGSGSGKTVTALLLPEGKRNRKLHFVRRCLSA